MNFEINEAEGNNILIIVIKKYGTDQIPSRLQEFISCKWNYESIRNCIKENKK